MKQDAVGHDLTGITAGTGEQRSYVLGRLYERRKKRIRRPSKDEKVENFSTFCGNASTAKEIAYSESSILTKTYLMISLTSSE